MRRLTNTTLVVDPAALLRQGDAARSRVVRAARNLLGAAERIPVLVADAQTIVDALARLVLRLDVLADHTARTIDDVDVTRASAEAGVRDLRQLEARLRALVDRAEPLLADDAPAQAAALLARAGPLLDQVDTVFMPLLGELHDAVPDVRDILPVVRRLEPVMVDAQTRLAGLPGAARLHKRGEQVIEDAEHEQAGSDPD